MESITVMNGEHAQKVRDQRHAKTIKTGGACIWCREYVFDKHEESGGPSPSWATEDGDFGCDYSPECSDDSCGSHAVATDPMIWAAPDLVECVRDWVEYMKNNGGDRDNSDWDKARAALEKAGVAV